LDHIYATFATLAIQRIHHAELHLQLCRKGLVTACQRCTLQRLALNAPPEARMLSEVTQSHQNAALHRRHAPPASKTWRNALDSSTPPSADTNDAARGGPTTRMTVPKTVLAGRCRRPWRSLRPETLASVSGRRGRRLPRYKANQVPMIPTCVQVTRGRRSRTAWARRFTLRS